VHAEAFRPLDADGPCRSGEMPTQAGAFKQGIWQESSLENRALRADCTGFRARTRPGAPCRPWHAC